MKFLKKAAYYYVAPLLTVCSVATSQLEAQCDPSPCAIDWCSLVVPALVGAAAGAATGAAVNSRGKRGKQGERGHQGERGNHGPDGDRGPPGDNPFHSVTNDSLKFTFTVNSVAFSGAVNNGASITPYINTPDGHVSTADSINFVNFNSDITTSFTIPTPVYGDYVVGFEVPEVASSVTIRYTIVVEPQGHNRTTTTYSDTVTVTTGDSHTQIPNIYTFGPIGTVPSA